MMRSEEALYGLNRLLYPDTKWLVRRWRMKVVRRAVRARGNVKLEGYLTLLLVRISCDVVLESDVTELSFQFVKILSALRQSCGVDDAATFAIS